MQKIKLRITVIAIILAYLPHFSFASTNDVDDSVKDTCLLRAIESKMDSLYNTWYVRKSIKNEAGEVQYPHQPDSLVPVFNDSVYLERIKAMPSYMPLTYNKIVRNFIHVYTVKKREKLAAILGLKDYYFPVFEEILDQYNLPLELKYVPVIESALNPGAVSKAGATGLWQFIYDTGRLYDLTINSYVDERRDPLKASHAACNYLNDLYTMFGDWMLVIAAYNCGPTNVYKAMRRSGKRDYWGIYYYLPRETRGYVPAFIAAMYAMTYYESHYIQPTNVDLPMARDTIIINKTIHLKQVSAVLGISYEQLKNINPQYRKSIVPGDHKPYAIQLPIKYTGDFIQLQDSIYAYKRNVFIENNIVQKEPASYSRSSYSHTPPAGNYKKLYYTVKTGDNLGFIAEWYNVKASDLRYWNNIRGSMIRTGEKLIIYVPENKVNYYTPVNSLTFEQKQKRAGYNENN